jgi:F-type H+-transporting ATPase subunit epsilon
MHIVIAKVDEVLFEGEAQSMTVPGTEGEMTVMGEHMPLISTLKAGEITVRLSEDAEPRVFKIDGGVLEVRHDGATVIL